MNINEFTTRLTEEIAILEINSETRSIAFLKWFLANYFRIDIDIAPDYICDGQNDKGIDGIYVDDLSNEIFIFQAKHSPILGSNQGDNDLKTFDGVKAWFESKENVEKLEDSLANQDLKNLISRLELIDRIEKQYAINLVFVTNKNFDVNANEYLLVVGDYYEAWDLAKLYSNYTYAGKDRPVIGKFPFLIDSGDVIHHPMPEGVDVLIFAAKALDIIQLAGIQDQTLFDKNVRYGLGKTRINREIAKTIKREDDHDSFVVFNNGITLICEDYKRLDNTIEIENYAVVNGCQTVLTLYENKESLDDRVKVFVRIIKTGKNEVLGKRITFYNNNQNAINPRDLKSNDKIQEDIQTKVFQYFDHKILYDIKRGEQKEGYDTILENDFVAQLIASFVLEEPQTAHQKTQIFTDSYQRIFSRHIDPPLIYLLSTMYDNIDRSCANIENIGVRGYKTTRFFIMYLFKEIFKKDDVASKMLFDADDFYITYKDKIDNAFDKLSQLLVLGINNHIKLQQEGDQVFDYKNVLRNSTMIKNMARDIISDYEKSLIFHEEGKISKLLE